MHLFLQLHRMVLLHRAFLPHLRHDPTHPDFNQSLRLPHIHPLPLHAATTSPTPIRLPGFRPARQCNLNLHVRELRQFLGCHAVHALRLRLLHRLHNDLPRRHLPTFAGKGRGSKRLGLEGVLHCAWLGIPEHDSRDDCRDGEPLLDGRPGGERRGRAGVSVQWGLLGTVALGGFVALGAKGGETGTVDRGEVQAEGRAVVD